MDRSKSYAGAPGRTNMQIEPYYGYGGYGGARPADFRSYSYSAGSVGGGAMSSSYSYQYEFGGGGGGGVVPATEEAKRGGSTTTSKSASKRRWLSALGDPDLDRKRRVASYKAYAVEGRVKGSFRKSFKWVKDRYLHLVYGWS